MKQKVTTINAHGNAPAGTRARILNVLVACEESQAECKAFRELGHNAFSCDLQPARYEDSWNIMGGQSCHKFSTHSLNVTFNHPVENTVHEHSQQWQKLSQSNGLRISSIISYNIRL